MLQQTDRSQLAVPSLFEDGGIILAIFRDTNLEVIFTSQLDVNNVACWENTAPHLSRAAVQEAVTTRQGLGFQQEMGAVQGKSAVPGHRAVPQHPGLLQVLPYLEGCQEREADMSTL